MLPIRIQDARNKPFPLYDPARKRLIAAGADRGGTGLGVVTEATGRKARGQTGTGALSAQIAYSLALVFIALLAFLNFRRGSYGFGVFMLCLLAYTFFELFIKRWYRRWRHKEQIVRALIAFDRCGSCGYELKGINTQDDGCLVCPECGAAWRADKRRSDDPPRWVRPKPWHRKYVHDDRGWRCRPSFGIRPSLLGRNAKRKRLLLRTSGALGWASYVSGALILLVLVGGLVLGFVFADAVIALAALGVTIVLLLLQTVLWPVAWWVSGERMRLALLDRGMCVCCDAALPEEPESDGRRVCQTCGSAWLSP